MHSERLKSHGLFHDGGLRHNNPSQLGLCEARKRWPGVQQPDILLSCGTGTARCPQSPRDDQPERQNLLKNGFIPRLIRCWSRSLDAQEAWEQLQNTLDVNSRQRYYRLDIEFDGQEPQLDDVSKMTEMVNRTKREVAKPSSIALIEKLSNSLIELSSPPIQTTEGLKCKAHLMCRVNRMQSQKLIQRLAACQATVQVGQVSIAEFTTVDHTLMGEQGLNTLFGRSDHKRTFDFVDQEFCGSANAHARKRQRR
ncbi:MAG: hypothetical protein M1839_003246 [Geoglossum umbratile]|nr:MAG: hypothetical protein M1839_003246 [Geoglossum umbratile]